MYIFYIDIKVQIHIERYRYMDAYIWVDRTAFIQNLNR